MTFTDQTGYKIELNGLPKRIISIVPSQTELLIDLGLKANLVGRTKFCIHPAEAVKEIPKIGGTKTIDIQKIRALNPDLIIGNKEENEKSQVQKLRADFPVWLSDIATLSDALEMIVALGDITGAKEKASPLKTEISEKFANLSGLNEHSNPRVLYLIWQNPWMAAAPGTFIHEMLELCGFVNVLNEVAMKRFKFLQNEGSLRYPAFDHPTLADLKPDIVLLSSEPFPFAKRYPKIMEELLPQAKIMLVDGEMFSWYGSRLRLSPAYFSQLINQLKLTANA